MRTWKFCGEWEKPNKVQWHRVNWRVFINGCMEGRGVRIRQMKAEKWEMRDMECGMDTHGSGWLKFDCWWVDDALNLEWSDVTRGEFLGHSFEGDVSWREPNLLTRLIIVCWNPVVIGDTPVVISRAEQRWACRPPDLAALAEMGLNWSYNDVVFLGKKQRGLIA